MGSLFAADLHLLPGRNPTQAAALRELLFVHANGADGLYLVGDVFHFWYERFSVHIGDYEECLGLFRQATNEGLKIELVWGNRDFTAGSALEALTGIRVLGPAAVVDLGDQSVFLTHGDAFCCHDWRYQAMRWCFTGPIGRFVHHMTPLWMIGPLIRLVQARSACRRNRAPKPFADIDNHAIGQALSHRGVKTGVAGHVHYPSDRSLIFPEGGRLLVLPPWSSCGSTLEYRKGDFISVKGSPPGSDAVNVKANGVSF